MNRIDKTFLELNTASKKAFIAYLTVGFPNIATTEKLVLALADSGVDIFELGIPFSDPLADGPVIQEASAYALKKGITLSNVFSLAERLRNKTSKPLLLMGYYNQILHFGIERFAEAAKSKGIDGIIVPDLPIEEATELRSNLSKNKIHLINFIAPTTDSKRAKGIAKKSKGFIYYVSLTGTTGARSNLPVEIRERVKQLKRITKTPVCVGFGISNREQFRRISSFSDGAIIGSAFISTIKKHLNDKNVVSVTAKFAKNIKS